MRPLFSLRFVAAVVAICGLVLIAVVFVGPPFDRNSAAVSSGTGPMSSVADNTIVASTIPAPGSDAATTVPPPDEVPPPVLARQVDFVEQVFSVADASFAVVDGVANQDTEFLLDASRAVAIYEGTPGVDYCGALDEVLKCAVLADLMGEAVVWFAVVPADDNGFVELPAIDELIDGRAYLMNGWNFPYAPILTRRCIDDDNPDTQDEFDSYQEFRRVLGDNFMSSYSIEEAQLVAVTCRAQLPWTEQSVTDAATQQ